MLTVDEITADVEQRRASTITFDESDEEPQAPEDVVVPPMFEEPIVPSSEVEEDGVTEAEYEEYEDSDDDDDDDEISDSGLKMSEHGKATLSTGCGSSFTIN
jgi:mitogen-activated protein kinase kinase kinase